MRASNTPNIRADGALRVDARLRQGVKEGTPGLSGGIEVEISRTELGLSSEPLIAVP
jgi:hypothetical protein